VGRLRCVKICSLLAVNCCLLARVAEDLVVGMVGLVEDCSTSSLPQCGRTTSPSHIRRSQTLENGSNRTFADSPRSNHWCYAFRLDNASSPRQSAPIVSLFSADLAIDLGTVNTRVYAGQGHRGQRALGRCSDNRTGEVQAVGKEAKEMLAVRPAISGLSSHERRGDRRLQSHEKMLNYFIQKAHQRRTLVHPRI